MNRSPDPESDDSSENPEIERGTILPETTPGVATIDPRQEEQGDSGQGHDRENRPRSIVDARHDILDGNVGELVERQKVPFGFDLPPTPQTKTLGAPKIRPRRNDEHHPRQKQEAPPHLLQETTGKEG